MSEPQHTGHWRAITILGERKIVLVPTGEDVTTYKGDMYVIELSKSTPAEEVKLIAQKLNETTSKISIREL